MERRMHCSTVSVHLPSAFNIYMESCACIYSFHIFFTLSALLLIHSACNSCYGSPVLAPNMSSCHFASSLPDGEITPLLCCAPMADYSPHLFRPNSSSSSVLRVRRPAHTVDRAYAEKLAQAYALMRGLPDEDPRSFVQQANIHCAYCNKAYNQMNSTELFQVHGSWLFFPFHRWYMFFHERILGRLLGDDNFAIPFWNYDHPDGSSIPWIYSQFNLTLADDLRDSPLHDAPAPAALDFSWDTDFRTREKQLRENVNTMYRTLVRDATSPKEFFGGPYRQGEAAPDQAGSVERRPHNTVHNWVGQKSQIGWKDMGSLYAAGRDPLFYAHHAQIDRLWEVWQRIPKHYDYDDEDYLDAEFAFYNEDADLVRVKVRDALNTSELGYIYQEVETPWMGATPVRQTDEPAELSVDDIVCIEGALMPVPCSLVVERDLEIVQNAAALGEYIETSVEYARGELWHMDIYINLPSADANTDTGCVEYFDYYSVGPQLSNNGSAVVTSNFTSSREMGRTLAALNLTEARSVVVTLVPRGHNTSASSLTFLGLSITYSMFHELHHAS